MIPREPSLLPAVKLKGSAGNTGRMGRATAAASSPPGQWAQLFREQQLGLPLKAGDSETLGLCPCPLGDPGQATPHQALVSLSVDLSLVAFFSQGLKVEGGG